MVCTSNGSDHAAEGATGRQGIGVFDSVQASFG
jgi:hypothetical protein